MLCAVYKLSLTNTDVTAVNFHVLISNPVLYLELSDSGTIAIMILT